MQIVTSDLSLPPPPPFDLLSCFVSFHQPISSYHLLYHIIINILSLHNRAYYARQSKQRVTTPFLDIKFLSVHPGIISPASLYQFTMFTATYCSNGNKIYNTYFRPKLTLYNFKCKGFGLQSVMFVILIYRAKNYGAGSGILSAQTDRCQHLARPTSS